ncbi:MAG: hypothetical protein EXR99_10015 [Gemmataceae bacterium]|nr:hypothetical protein [Gemmataceae bacterium]
MNKFVPLFLIALVLAAPGCGGSASQDIEIKVADPLDGVRTLLKGYAEGQPLRSEVTSFPDLVNTVRKVDANKADMLEKGFADLQKKGANIKAKAKELLEKFK